MTEIVYVKQEKDFQIDVDMGGKVERKTLGDIVKAYALVNGLGFCMTGSEQQVRYERVYFRQGGTQEAPILDLEGFNFKLPDATKTWTEKEISTVMTGIDYLMNL